MLVPFAALELAQTGWPTVSAQGAAGALFLGVVASGLAYLVYNAALRVLDAGQVGALSNIDPIVGVLAAFVFLNETLTIWQVVGGAAALVGMWLSSVEPSDKRSA